MLVSLSCATSPRQWTLQAQDGAQDQCKNITFLLQPQDWLLSVQTPIPSNHLVFAACTDGSRPYTLFLHPALVLLSTSLSLDQPSLPSSGQVVHYIILPSRLLLVAPACELTASLRVNHYFSAYHSLWSIVSSHPWRARCWQDHIQLGLYSLQSQ